MRIKGLLLSDTDGMHMSFKYYRHSINNSGVKLFYSKYGTWTYPGKRVCWLHSDGDGVQVKVGDHDFYLNYGDFADLYRSMQEYKRNEKMLMGKTKRLVLKKEE